MREYRFKTIDVKLFILLLIPFVSILLPCIMTMLFGITFPQNIWLAFAHIVIAIAFVGVLTKPVRNIWIVHFGMIACIAILPLAFICGSIRQIPFYWQLIDCSFGVFGIIPLYILHRYIKKLEKLIDYQPSRY